MGDDSSILELSFQMGETLLRNGAEISRVQETMERVARAYHAEKFNVYVLTNAILPSDVSKTENIPQSSSTFREPRRIWDESAP